MAPTSLLQVKIDSERLIEWWTLGCHSSATARPFLLEQFLAFCFPNCRTTCVSKPNSKRIHIDVILPGRKPQKLVRVSLSFERASTLKAFLQAHWQQNLREQEHRSSATQSTRTSEFARFLDDPDVRKAKTKKEALNIVKQKQTGFFLEALGEVIKVEQEQNLHSHRLIEGDCLEEILKLPSGYFSVILTDPPYGIDVQSAGSQVSHGHPL
jgi:hypothetical protein